MGLEVSTTISGLVSSNPVSGDLLSNVDDHLRLIKNVLKKTFPGANGQGFTIPITATETELNFVKGATSNIQAQLNANSFASGTRMLFNQATAPTGWTQDVSDAANNRMLRVVNTAGGGTGGSHSPILMNVVPSHTHPFTTGGVSNDHTHTDSGHAHGYSKAASSGNQKPASGGTAPYDTLIGDNTNIGYANLGGMSANHTHSGNTNNNAGASNWTPRYNNVIICQKN
jgi:hypothetical protein